MDIVYDFVRNVKAVFLLLLLFGLQKSFLYYDA